MAYSIEQYFNQDTGRRQWAVCCDITGVWYFAKRYGKAAAQALANRMNKAQGEPVPQNEPAKIVQLPLFKFEQLSDGAQNTAFEQWQNDELAAGYDDGGLLRDFLNILDNEHGIKLKNYEYDSRYNFTLNLNDDFTGLTALKRAMRLYDLMTLTPVFYFKKDGKAFKQYFSHARYGATLEHKSRVLKTRDGNPSGCYLGCDFLSGLKSAIDSKNLNLDFSNYLEAAFDSVFTTCVADWEYHGSEAAFDESEYKRGLFTAEGVQYDDID